MLTGSGRITTSQSESFVRSSQQSSGERNWGKCSRKKALTQNPCSESFLASAAWRRSPPTTPKQVLGDKLFTKTTSMGNKKDKDTLSYENLQIWLKDGFEGLESEKRGLPASKILV